MRHADRAGQAAVELFGALSSDQLREGGCAAYTPLLRRAGSRTRIACVGDSITRGDGAHEPGRGSHTPFKGAIGSRGNYAALLQAALGAGRYAVGAFAHSGRSALPTRDALRRTAEYRSLVRRDRTARSHRDRTEIAPRSHREVAAPRDRGTARSHREIAA